MVPSPPLRSIKARSSRPWSGWSIAWAAPIVSRRFQRELSQLAERQAALANQTAELAGRTLAKQLKDLSAEETSQLAGAARQQSEIAGEFDAAEQAIDQAANAAGPSDPNVLRAIADAMRHARRRDVVGRMRAAGDRIERNQLGQAMDDQERIEDDLQDILDMLSGRSSNKASADDTASGETPAADIRRMQLEINRRTQQLETQFDAKGKIEHRGPPALPSAWPPAKSLGRNARRGCIRTGSSPRSMKRPAKTPPAQMTILHGKNAASPGR